MEQLHTPRRSGPLQERARDAVRFGASSETADEDGTVEVVWGANMDALDVAGLTIDEVRAQLDAAYNIAPGAAVHVNGIEATGDTRLVAGDSLEFVRAAGEKGGA